MKIACIGEVMIELIAGEGNTAELNVAGDTYNTAVYLARQLDGQIAQVHYVTVLGKDRFSDRIIEHMAANGVDASYVARHPTRIPGLYAIETDASGERSFTYWRSGSAARTLFGEDGRDAGAVLANFDMVVASGISLAILPDQICRKLFDAIDEFRNSGGTVVFDSNYRPHLWSDPDRAREVTAAMWRRTDIALPSIDDEMTLFGEKDETELLDRLQGYGIKSGALKRGEIGPLDLASGKVIDVRPAAKVVDTTAAGDSFNAGYIAKIVRGGAPNEAMIAGHSLAMQVIGKRGAIVDLDG